MSTDIEASPPIVESEAAAAAETARRRSRMDREHPHYRWVALSNTTLGALLASINSSIVLISLPAIFRGIGLNPLAPGNVSYLLWMLMGYLVATAVLVVPLGRLGDIFGRDPVGISARILDIACIVPLDRDLDLGVVLGLEVAEHRERWDRAAARAQVARAALDVVDALELVAHPLLGRDRADERAWRDAERGGDLGERLAVERIHAGERDLIVGQPEQRHDEVLLGELRRQLGLEVRIGLVEVVGERRRQAALLAEHAGQLVEIDEAELDQVRSQSAAPHDLGAQGLLELQGIETACGDEQVAESLGQSHYATVTSLQR